MNHQDHVNLLRGAVSQQGGRWADFGSGDGAFTLALRDWVGAKGEIFSIEKDKARLDRQQRDFHDKFPDSDIHFVHADFTRPFDLPPLDGIVIANALHFFRDKEKILRLVHGYLKSGAHLVLVEYNVDSGNPWVPYPISFDAFVPLALRTGFAEPRRLATVPSRFLREIYSALAMNS